MRRMPRCGQQRKRGAGCLLARPRRVSVVSLAVSDRAGGDARQRHGVEAGPRRRGLSGDARWSRALSDGVPGSLGCAPPRSGSATPRPRANRTAAGPPPRRRVAAQWAQVRRSAELRGSGRTSRALATRHRPERKRAKVIFARSRPSAAHQRLFSNGLYAHWRGGEHRQPPSLR